MQEPQRHFYAVLFFPFYLYFSPQRAAKDGESRHWQHDTDAVKQSGRICNSRWIQGHTWPPQNSFSPPSVVHYRSVEESLACLACNITVSMQKNILIYTVYYRQYILKRLLYSDNSLQWLTYKQIRCFGLRAWLKFDSLTKLKPFPVFKVCALGSWSWMENSFRWARVYTLQHCLFPQPLARPCAGPAPRGPY